MFPYNNIFGFPTTQLELYPRRRPTEFYYDPQPLEEYQSRQGEHPQDKLSKYSGSQVNMIISDQRDNQRITPPRNSDMRLMRNSYFS